MAVEKSAVERLNVITPKQQFDNIVRNAFAMRPYEKPCPAVI